MNNTSARRTAAALALVAGTMLAAPHAHAFSRANHFFNSFNMGVQYQHESTTRLRIEGKDNAGALVGTRYCPVNANCSSTVPGAVNNVVVLEIDLEREEVVLEKCRGVISTVPQLRCENGDLEVNLRVRYGELVITTRRDSLLGAAVNGAPARFEFAEDPTKFWNIGPYWYDSTTGAYRFPAGRHKVFAPDLVNHCKPTQRNPGVLFTLPAGGRTTVEIVYGATECTVLFTTDVEVGGLTMTSDRGPLTCEAKGQRGIPAVKSVCTGVFPFNQTVTVSATVPAGLEPFFQWVNNTCERTSVTTQCRFKPTYDSSLDIFTDIEMRARAAGAAPPPTPVGLAFAKSASSPGDGNAAKGQTGVPMLNLQATAQNGTAMLHSLTVKASGTGRDDLDLVMVKVVVDANGNGAFDAGETVLAQGRPSADNGELRLAFGSAIPITDTADLLVVADIGSDVHSAAAAVLGGATLLLAFGLFAIPRTSRRRSLVPVALAVTTALLVLAACGGGGGADPAAAVPPAAVPPPAPVLLTYQLDLVAVDATDAATPAAPLTIRALPLAGATITVQQ